MEGGNTIMDKSSRFTPNSGRAVVSSTTRSNHACMCIGGKKFYFMRMFLVAQFGIFCFAFCVKFAFLILRDTEWKDLELARSLDSASLLFVCLIPQHQHKIVIVVSFSEFLILWNFLHSMLAGMGGWKLGTGTGLEYWRRHTYRTVDLEYCLMFLR